MCIKWGLTYNMASAIADGYVVRSEVMTQKQMWHMFYTTLKICLWET